MFPAPEMEEPMDASAHSTAPAQPAAAANAYPQELGERFEDYDQVIPAPVIEERITTSARPDPPPLKLVAVLIVAPPPPLQIVAPPTLQLVAPPKPLQIVVPPTPLQIVVAADADAPARRAAARHPAARRTYATARRTAARPTAAADFRHLDVFETMLTKLSTFGNVHQPGVIVIE